jgi:sterol desaturase/sphingolipid hydroxylase (fatty acid hydroxylase superfamily)
MAQPKLQTAPRNIALQGAPSKWMMVAVLQSALWFFALPHLLKSYWNPFFHEFTPSMAEATLFLLIIPFYLVYILVVALPPYLLQWECFEQYKISNSAWPWLDKRTSIREAFWKLTYKTIRVELLLMLIIFPAMLYAKAIFAPNSEISFANEDWPTYIKSVTDLMSLALVHEFFFYWTHRIMHMFPQLYKYHKVHHEYKQNDVLASQYFHPIDFALSIGGPAILTTAIVHPHSITQLQFGLWILYANFDDHLGYAFPWSPVRWFPLAATTDCHEFHHCVNMGCYSSKLIVYDVLFGTDKAYWRWKRGKVDSVAV